MRQFLAYLGIAPEDGVAPDPALEPAFRARILTVAFMLAFVVFAFAGLIAGAVTFAVLAGAGMLARRRVR